MHSELEIRGEAHSPARDCDFNFGGGDGGVERVEVSYRRHVHEAAAAHRGRKTHSHTHTRAHIVQSNPFL